MPESKVIACRFCQTKNKIPLETIFQGLLQAKCGRCAEPLFFHDHTPFTGLTGNVYQHPVDLQALANLQKLPGVDSVLKTLLKESYERAERLFYKANSVAVTPRQLPRLHQLLLDAAQRLDWQPPPALYVLQNPQVNAFIIGVEEPFIVVTSGLLELMTDEEILFVLGHEIGHAQARHLLYKMASRLLSITLEVVADMTFGIGKLLTAPLQLALLKWDRCSELTSDRAGLLAIRKVEVAIRALMKLAGGSRSVYQQMDYQEFIRQAEDFQLDQDDSTLNKVFVVLQVISQSHPFPVWRAAELLQWAKAGCYLEILAGQYAGNDHEHTA